MEDDTTHSGSTHGVPTNQALIRLRAFQEWQPMLSGYAQKLQQSAQIQAEAAKAVSGILPKVAASLDATDIDNLQQAFAKLESFNREAREFNDRSLAQILASAQRLEQELKTYTASLSGAAANTDQAE